MSDNISYVAKWLDPKNNPLPKEGEIIAYIDHRVTTISEKAHGFNRGMRASVIAL